MLCSVHTNRYTSLGCPPPEDITSRQPDRCLPPYSSTARTTCHQKPAATAAKMANSGRNEETPKLRPVQPAPAIAAIQAKGLRMAVHRAPGKLQLHPLPQSRQGLKATGHGSGGFATVHAAPPRCLPVRAVAVLPTVPTMYDGFHEFLLFSCRMSRGVGH